MYQWGRLKDGHQCRNSSNTATISTTNSPGNGNFITTNSGNNDWLNPQSNTLWQGVGGTNNPCPSGYRLPTETEWDAERASWSSQNPAGALASPLKLPLANERNGNTGSIINVGNYGFYWSSTVNGTSSTSFYFFSSFGGGTAFGPYTRSSGLSVRCIKN
jgi:uncharacterized protein (TIGR02145 family)